MFKLVEQALDKFVRSDRVSTVSMAEMGSLVQSKSVANMIVHSVLSNTGLLFPIAGTVMKLVDSAVGEYPLRDWKKASPIAVVIKSMI